LLPVISDVDGPVAEWKTSAAGPFHAYERKTDGYLTINLVNRQQQSQPPEIFREQPAGRFNFSA
jgi:hypothetical protein